MSDEIPVRCNHCLVFSLSKPYADCEVCRDQAMRESYLCDIVRSSFSGGSFICHAFRPHLTLVGRNEGEKKKLPVCQEKHAYFAEAVRMVAAGHCAGGVCSKAGCQDAGNGLVEKFHVVWAVRHRKPLFLSSNIFISFLHDIFISCGQLMAGKVYLLWLAPDHLHLYLECAGWESEYEIVEDLQGLVHDALMQEFPALKKEYEKTLIWERDFFLEKISSS